MKNRLQHAAGDCPRFVGNRITITPLAARINVTSLDSPLDQNAVTEKATNLTGNLRFDSFTVNFRDRLANGDHVADRSKRFEDPGLRHSENSGYGIPIDLSGHAGIGLCGTLPNDTT